MASQTMLAGMKFSITGTANSHEKALSDKNRMPSMQQQSLENIAQCCISRMKYLPKQHFSSSYLRVNMGCALAIVFQVHSLYVPKENRSPSRGHFWETLVIVQITLEIGQNHLSIEAQCDHHRGPPQQLYIRASIARSQTEFFSCWLVITLVTQQLLKNVF